MTSETGASKGPSPRSAQLLSVDFTSAERKRAWVDWCAERNLVAGRHLRDLAEREMGGDGAGVGIAAGRNTSKPAGVRPRPDERNKIPTKVYLTPSEHEGVQVAAKHEGYGFPEWIIAAVRARLTGEPSHGQAELESLRESNVQLAEVAIELAAWRRREPTSDVVERLKVLEADVRTHVERVSGVLAQGVRRWRVKS